EKTGLFKKHGLDVDTKFIAQKDRHLAFASGDIQAIATVINTQVSYAAAGIDLAQVLVLDISKGGDGIAVRSSINSLAELKGKTVACDGAGSAPYFMLTWMLKKNGMSMKDLKLATLGPKEAATAFVAGQYDAAASYEPYLSIIRDDPKAGKILATTIDYPCIVDTLSFAPDFIARNKAAVAAFIAAWHEALDMIKAKPDESYKIMGERVNQTPAQFKASAQFIAWQGKAENKAYFASQLMAFMETASEIQIETGIIRARPDLKRLMDASFAT
ncbi:MAG: ABC transporter substrate-binding protein, partial [Alphaproteobacteria bacterium]|nr:ABC transporter substrate-binding protein [Alphaproteobacteria bacterium]